METIFMNKNRKTSESNKFVLSLSQRLGLRSSNKHVSIQNLSICQAWKNTRQQYNNKKTKKKKKEKKKKRKKSLKTLVPTRNNDFELPDGLYLASNILSSTS